jgi:hypothetical protein
MIARDGGKSQIWICVEPKPKTCKNVIIFNHGLTQGAKTNYCKEFCY